MKKYRRNIFKGGLFILILFCLALPALPAMAGSGIGLGPATIDIVDAMRGSIYKNSITIFNTGDQYTDYGVTIDGEAAAWVTLDYQGQPFERITVATEGKEAFGVTVTVPGDAANRKYTATVTVTSVPGGASGSGSGAGVALSAYANINITVTGTQHISGKVNGITVKDQETGFPLVLKVFFENTGNVIVAPSIDVNIDWNGNRIDSFNYSGTEIAPSKGDFIDVKWDTTGRVPGDYIAHVIVNLDGQQIYTQDVSFKILVLGSLTRSGELGDVSVKGTMEVGKLAKIEGVFSNTGAANVIARLTGEILLDGNLVQILEGDEVMVDSGRQATLSAYFTPEQEGKYTAKAQVDFGGKKTDVKEITFNIGTGQGSSNEDGGTGKSFNMLYPIVGVVGLMIIVMVLVALKRRAPQI